MAKTTPTKQIKYAENQMHRMWNLFAFAFVLLIFVGQPLVISPAGSGDVDAAKRVYFIVMAGALLVAVFGAFINALLLGYKPHIDLKAFFKTVRLYEYALFAYWLVHLISTLAAPAYQLPAEAQFMTRLPIYEDIYIQTAYLCIFFIVGRCYKPKTWHMLVFTGVGAAVAALGTLLYYGAITIASITDATGTNMIMFATISNKNIAATYMCLVFCVSLVLFSQKTERWHWWFLPIALIIFTGLLAAESDSAYVGLGIGGPICFALIAKDRLCAARLLSALGGCAAVLWLFCTAYEAVFASAALLGFLKPIAPIIALVCFALAAALRFIRMPEMKKRTWRITWVCLLVLIIIAGALALPTLAQKSDYSTIKEAQRLLSGGEMDDAMGSGRGYVWKRSMTLVPERLLIGHGSASFPEVFNQYYYFDSLEKNKVSFAYAHNEYVQMLVEIGVLGLLCYLAFVVLLFIRARRTLDSPLTIALVFAMAVFLVQAFFNFSTTLTHPIVWTLWGVFGALVGGKGAQEEKELAS